MTFPITLASFFPALMSALLTVGSLYAMGRLVLGAVGWDRFGNHVPVGVGFGLNHLLFLTASLFMDGPDAVALMNVIHVAALAVLLYKRYGRLMKTRPVDPFWFVLLTLAFLPYFFRVLSPPMNIDGLNFYLPQVEWVYHRGLAFNPHLTGYTTMPMAAEYLFAQAYGLAGIPAVVLTDAFFCVLMLRLAFDVAGSILNPIWTAVFLSSILLFPHSIGYLFGSGKVDMLNVYLVFMGSSMLLKPLASSRVAVMAAIFLVSCSVKFTVWLQLAMPIAGCLLYLAHRRRWRLLSMTFLLATLFIGPVLLKNQIQVGNPFAPVILKSSQFVYVAPHQSQDWEEVLSMVVGESTKKKSPHRAIANFLEVGLPYILYSVALVLLAVAGAMKLDVRRMRTVLVFLVASLLPFHIFFYDKPQPPRFILFSLMLVMLLIVYLLQRISKSLAPGSECSVAFPLLVPPVLLLLLNTYGSHGRLVDRYIESKAVGLKDWYLSDNKFHYAVSQTIVDEGWLDRKVMYLSPLVTGTIPYSQLDKLHTDSEIMLNRSRFWQRIHRYDYIFCTKREMRRFDLMDKEVILNFGPFLLLRK